jgi:hypothetical protein
LLVNFSVDDYSMVVVHLFYDLRGYIMKFPVAIILTALLYGVATLVSGCAEPAIVVGAAATTAVVVAATEPVKPGDIVGVADTKAERQQRIKDVRSNQWRQFVDDWDAFWLQDKGTRLSEYPIR